MRNRLPRPRGFTLVELLIVIGVLALMAIVVLPRIDGSDRSSRVTVTASNIADVTRTIDAFYVMHDSKYPAGWDSLLDATDNTQIYEGNPNCDTNDGLYRWSGWLEASPITQLERHSFLRVMSTEEHLPAHMTGTMVYDHDPTATDANQSTDNATGREMEIDDYCAFVTKASIYEAFGLDSSATGYRLLALGIGPHCTLVGDAQGGLTEPPVAWTGGPHREHAYRRLIAVFKVYGDRSVGVYAELAGVVTSYGDTLTSMTSSIMD